MTISHAISFPALRAAYTEIIGEPTDVLELKRQHEPAIPSEMSVLFFQPRIRDAGAFTYLATMGMSALPMQGSGSYVELGLRVDGDFKQDRLLGLARSLAELAVIPFREKVSWGSDTVLENVRLPLFGRMSCAVLADWSIQTPVYLPGIDPPVLVLSLHPLFPAEAQVAGQRGVFTLYRELASQGINWCDPSRLEGDMKVLLKKKRAQAEPTAPAHGGKVTGDVNAVWADIESWYRRYAPGLEGDLGAPASEEALQVIEEELAAPLPEGLRASLLRRNGTISVDGYRYLSSEDLLRVWRSMMTQLDRGAFAGVAVVYGKPDVFRDSWWHRRWVPFAADSEGNLFCADSDPGPNGRIGQVLRFDRVEGPSDTGYASFAEWLEWHRDELLAGEFRLDGDGLIVRRRDA